MYQKILVPIDLSPVSPAIVAWASVLARDLQASLILLHVQETFSGELGGELYVPALIGENPELLKRLQAINPEDSEIPCEHRLLLGVPAATILRIAEDEHVSLIVMGSRGRTGLTRLVMGSVAETVLRHAPCPVLVFKQPGNSRSGPRAPVGKAATA